MGIESKGQSMSGSRWQVLGWLVPGIATCLGCSISIDIDGHRFQSGLEGNGVVVTEPRLVEPFDGIDVSGVVEVEVLSGEEPLLEVTTDENLQSIVETTVTDGMLRVRTTENHQGKVSVTAVVPTLSKYHGSGATKGVMALANIDALEVDLSGVSSLECQSGDVQSLKVHASGVSKFDGAKLHATEATVDVSGSSNASVHADAKLTVDASGVSRVEYSGNPEVVKSISGVSKLVRVK